MGVDHIVAMTANQPGQLQNGAKIVCRFDIPQKRRNLVHPNPVGNRRLITEKGCSHGQMNVVTCIAQACQVVRNVPLRSTRSPLRGYMQYFHLSIRHLEFLTAADRAGRLNLAS
jgi:hypothetical protein